MENRPEPLVLMAKTLENGAVKVTLGSETIVVSNSLDYVSESIRALKRMGYDHETHVVIHGVSSNVAWNGAIKQHTAA
jgi:hypothetical protein